ncbi:MAG: KamA family radical SAM protein [Myxococcales bacterium]
MVLRVIQDALPSPEHAESQQDVRHRDLRGGEFWRVIPAFRQVSEQEFLDHQWQARQSVTKPKALLDALTGLVSETFVEDAARGFLRAPMSVRVSPYLLSLVDWSAPEDDPIRRQFIPLESEMLPDHPKLGLDSLAEQADSPVPGLTHRYPDKVLFLPLNTCPVYCRFCTRSYAVGPDTEVEKLSLKVNMQRWEHAFEYLKLRSEVEDVVVSGGDSYTLKPEQLRFIGDALLDIPNIRRIRIASKGPAVMPQKILSDDAWFGALVGLVERGRKLHKQVVLHTHFNHPNEITRITEQAMNRLFEHGVTVRNQSVMQARVNDSVETMITLVRRLSYVNVQPYYVYQHDLVRGVEDLRTSVHSSMQIEKAVRGATAGFNTPTFVVDAPGGGGKRQVHSAEYYDRVTGVSVYSAPSVKPGRLFCYFDPIRSLPEEGRRRWADPKEHDRIVEEALRAAR